MEYPPGWTCELTILRLEQYLLATLTYTQTLCVAEHLEACPPCMQRLVLIRSVTVSTGLPDQEGAGKYEGGYRG